MPKFEYRFDIATILLASALTALGVTAAQAGGKGGITGGDVVRRALEAGRTRPQVYAFPESGTMGCYPDGTLLRDAAGALYATTYACGPANSGSVVRLKPPEPGQTRWTPSLLYTFRDGDDGSTPNAGLVMDASGALYGTTTYGGAQPSGRGLQADAIVRRPVDPHYAVRLPLRLRLRRPRRR